MQYEDIDDYFNKFREYKLNIMERNDYIRNRYRLRVPRLLMLTNLKIHLTSKDLRAGQKYKFVYNEHNGNPVKTFIAEFVDTASNVNYGHVIIFKNMTRNGKGEPDENGSSIDKTVRQLPTKNLQAYLIEKK